MPESGILSPEAFVIVLEKKTLLGTDYFSEFRMPSSDDVNQAPRDIINRLHAVTIVDADKLGFNSDSSWVLAGGCVFEE